MPRKKPRGPEQTEEHPMALMLPPPRPHRHGHDEKDPYEAPPGSVPGRVSREKLLSQKPITRELTAEEKQQQAEIAQSLAAKAARYNAWLDALIESGGDREQAAMAITGHTQEYVRVHLQEIIADIHQGRGASEVSEVFARHDLDLTAQAAVLRKWVYSPIPAASLAALKIVQDVVGDTQEVGSFESFLRMAKLSKGA